MDGTMLALILFLGIIVSLLLFRKKSVKSEPVCHTQSPGVESDGVLSDTEVVTDNPDDLLSAIKIGEFLDLGEMLLGWVIPLHPYDREYAYYCGVCKDNVRDWESLTASEAETLLRSAEYPLTSVKRYNATYIRSLRDHCNAWIPKSNRAISLDEAILFHTEYIEQIEKEIASRKSSSRELLSAVFPKVDRKYFKSDVELHHLPTLIETGITKPYTFIGYLREHEIKDGFLYNIVVEDADGEIMKANMYDYITRVELDVIISTISFTSKFDLMAIWEAAEAPNLSDVSNL